MRFVAAVSFAIAIGLSTGKAQPQQTELPPPAVVGIGYKTVTEALEALKTKPGTNITYTKPDAWTIITEPGGMTQWSFTPPGHYANPAVVKREVRVAGNGDVSVETSALCEAEKTACDKLVEEFKVLNENIRRTIQQRLKQGVAK